MVMVVVPVAVLMVVAVVVPVLVVIFVVVVVPVAVFFVVVVDASPEVSGPSRGLSSAYAYGCPVWATSGSTLVNSAVAGSYQRATQTSRALPRTLAVHGCSELDRCGTGAGNPGTSAGVCGVARRRQDNRARWQRVAHRLTLSSSHDPRDGADAALPGQLKAEVRKPRLRGLWSVERHYPTGEERIGEVPSALGSDHPIIL